MKILSTKAFIVSMKKMNEADLLINYITEDYGRITCFANNARKSRKRFLGKLEPAMLTNIKFYEKNGISLNILYEADIIEDYKNIRKNVDIYISITKIIEITKVLCQERDNNHGIFNLIRAVFSSLNSIEPDNSTPFSHEGAILKHELYFISNVLKFGGIFPNFTSCTLCSKKNYDRTFLFSMKRGGVVCGDCARTIEAISLPVNFINLSGLMIRSDPTILKKLTVNDSMLKNCVSFLEDFLSFYTGKVFNSFLTGIGA